MSLITRCPACTTVFKVVPDQLRVSEGWVRCGQCDEVFDANAHLQTSLPAEIAVLQEQEQVEAEAEAVDQSEIATSHVTDSVAAYDWDAIDGPDVIGEPTFDAGQSSSIDAFEESEVPCEGSPESSLPGRVESSVDSVLEISPGMDVVPEPAPDPIPFVAAQEVEQPAFMLGAGSTHRTEESWRSRWLWRGIAMLLAAMLPLQWVIQERDRLSASAPDLKPAFEMLCAPVGCKIAPLQHIEAVVIDSSAFTKLRPDVYQLSFAVKSNALVEIAAPSLELTLTDMQDQPLVRRILMPSELGRSNQTLPVGAEWTGTQLLALTANPVTAKITGYRLVAFYP